MACECCWGFLLPVAVCLMGRGATGRVSVNRLFDTVLVLDSCACAVVGVRHWCLFWLLMFDSGACD